MKLVTNPAKIFFFWSSVRFLLFAFIIFLPWGCSSQMWKSSSWATTLSASSEAFLNSPASSGSSSSYKGWKDTYHFKSSNNITTISSLLHSWPCLSSSLSFVVLDQQNVFNTSQLSWFNSLAASRFGIFDLFVAETGYFKYANILLIIWSGITAQDISD